MRMRQLAALFLLLVLIHSAAIAQPEAHDVGLFLDAAGTIGSGHVGDFVLFDFFVVGFDLDGGVLGYEFGITAPVTLTVLSTQQLGGYGVLGGPWNNVIAGTGGCVDGSGALVLVRYNGAFLVPGAASAMVDLPICIGPSTPSSFGGLTPGYLQCDNTLVPFGVAQNGAPNYPNGCLILNPAAITGLEVEPESFGQVKARY